MALPSRNISSQTFVNLDSGNLLKEDGDMILLENGDGILLENPTQNPNLSSRNTSTIAAYPSRN